MRKGQTIPRDAIERMVATRRRNGSYNFSEEAKKNMGLAQKGKKISEETKRKIGLAHKGKIVSEETKNKMVATRRQRGNYNSWMKGIPCSDEMKHKISETKKRNFRLGLQKHSWIGKHHSIETKNKISLKHKGMKPSEETKEKMRLNSASKKEGYISPCLGKKLSPERIEKIRLSHLGKKQSQEWIKKRTQNSIGRKLSQESINKIKAARAKQIFPKVDSSIEVKIQNYLKLLGIDFLTHQHMKINHCYQCDIFIPSMNLVIECDGNYWHKYPVGNDIDHIRTKELIQQGFRVLRLWEFEINKMSIDELKNKLNLEDLR